MYVLIGGVGCTVIHVDSVCVCVCVCGSKDSQIRSLSLSQRGNVTGDAGPKFNATFCYVIVSVFSFSTATLLIFHLYLVTINRTTIGKCLLLPLCLPTKPFISHSPTPTLPYLLQRAWTDPDFYQVLSPSYSTLAF